MDQPPPPPPFIRRQVSTPLSPSLVSPASNGSVIPPPFIPQSQTQRPPPIAYANNNNNNNNNNSGSGSGSNTPISMNRSIVEEGSNSNTNNSVAPPPVPAFLPRKQAFPPPPRDSLNVPIPISFISNQSNSDKIQSPTNSLTAQTGRNPGSGPTPIPLPLPLTGPPTSGISGISGLPTPTSPVQSFPTQSIPSPSVSASIIEAKDKDIDSSLEESQIDIPVRQRKSVYTYQDLNNSNNTRDLTNNEGKLISPKEKEKEKDNVESQAPLLLSQTSRPPLPRQYSLNNLSPSTSPSGSPLIKSSTINNNNGPPPPISYGSRPNVNGTPSASASASGPGPGSGLGLGSGVTSSVTVAPAIPSKRPGIELLRSATMKTLPKVPHNMPPHNFHNQINNNNSTANYPPSLQKTESASSLNEVNIQNQAAALMAQAFKEKIGSSSPNISAPSSPIQAPLAPSATVATSIPFTQSQSPSSNNQAPAPGVLSLGPPVSNDGLYLVVRELVESELSFVKHIKVLVEVFIRPYQSSCQLYGKLKLGTKATDSRVQVLFSSAVQILTLNTQFAQELVSLLDGWNEWAEKVKEASGDNVNEASKASPHLDIVTRLGELILSFAPLFRIFSSYAAGHEAVSSLITSATAKSSSKFSVFLQQCYTDTRMTGGQTLQSMLIMPIQRVPRYKLLLEEIRRKLIKHLEATGSSTSIDNTIASSSNKDKADRAMNSLDVAIGHVSESASFINETIRQREQREVLRALETKFVGGIDLNDTDIPHALKKEGKLLRQTRNGTVPYYFHLFHDLLLYSEDTVQGYKLHRRMPLSEISIQDRSQSSSQGNFSFMIASPQKSFVVTASSKEEKTSWMNEITNAINNLSVKDNEENGNGFVAPVWTQDHLLKNCTLCTQPFTVFVRRHHCRACGALVCHDCSSSRRLIVAIDPKTPVRVCVNCAQNDTVNNAPNNSSINPITRNTSGSIVSMGMHRRDSVSVSVATSSVATSGGTLDDDVTDAASPSFATSTINGSRSRVPSITRGSCAVAGCEKERDVGRRGYCNMHWNSLANNGQVNSPNNQTTNSNDDDESNETIKPLSKDSWENTLALIERNRTGTLAKDSRYEVVCELLISERQYCSDLSLLLENYVKPLVRSLAGSSTSSKSSGDLAIFLHNIEPIVTLNNELLKVLQERVDSWKDGSQSLADVFLRFGALFDLYRQYSMYHDRGVKSIYKKCGELIKKLEEEHKKKVREDALKKIAQNTLNERANGNNNASVSLPSSPPDKRSSLKMGSVQSNTPIKFEELVQFPLMRITQYLWLLSQLLTKTPSNHVDFNALSAAVAAVQSAWDGINQAVVENDHLEKLKKITAKFVTPDSELNLANPHRFLMREGLLKRQTRRGLTSFYFHLFNDLLLYSEETVKGFKLHRRLELKDMKIMDFGSTPSLSNAIQILSPEKSFVVCASSESDKEKWMASFNKAFKLAGESNNDNENENSSSDNLMGNGNVAIAPIWQKDDTQKSCSLCSKEFTLFNRRHHCRHCGGLVCNSCSSGKALLENIDKKSMQRVCDKCLTIVGSQPKKD